MFTVLCSHPEPNVTGHFAFRGRSGWLLLLLPPGGGWASSPTPSGTTTRPAPTPPLPLGWWGACLPLALLSI